MRVVTGRMGTRVMNHARATAINASPAAWFASWSPWNRGSVPRASRMKNCVKKSIAMPTASHVPATDHRRVRSRRPSGVAEAMPQGTHGPRRVT